MLDTKLASWPTSELGYRAWYYWELSQIASTKHDRDELLTLAERCVAVACERAAARIALRVTE